MTNKTLTFLREIGWPGTSRLLTSYCVLVLDCTEQQLKGIYPLTMDESDESEVKWLVTQKHDRIPFEMSWVKTSFLLHSETHHLLYPQSRYPLTHLIDRQNIARHLWERIELFRRAICSFLSFIALSLFSRTHVHLYNQLFGPFHVDQEALKVHVKNFDAHFWWQFRKEYFQVELGEDNIQNSARTHETIRVYSDPETRGYHTATINKVETMLINDVLSSSISFRLSIVHHSNDSMCFQPAHFEPDGEDRRTMARYNWIRFFPQWRVCAQHHPIQFVGSEQMWPLN